MNAEPRPLADLEMDELVRVEATFVRRADTTWSVERYLGAIVATHFRYDRKRVLLAKAEAA